ncbi:hypothetical protein B1B_16100 [mine drainage metagenome]|uniref:Uncharacterized protein n=2 Tax=mine drainage metagenome TaxID=410659 RepID=T1A9J1_9ZZZZ
MTCEVAVMNKRGIALAADSAVTLSDNKGNAKKIYHTAEKLFSLSPELPVAIMTYGAADIMGVPWETVVKVYAQKLDGQRFGTLAAYAQNFIDFIKGAYWLFPMETQARYVRDLVGDVWKRPYKNVLDETLGKGKGKPTRKDMLEKLAALIEKDHDLWERRYQDLASAAPDYGQRVRETFAEAIDKVESDLFEGFSLTAPIKEGLRKTVELAYQKEWFHPMDRGRYVVIAGMGEAEPFPVLLEYEVGTLAAGELRYRKAGETRVDNDMDGWIKPFAQSEIIDSVIQGIHPNVYDRFIEEVARMTLDDEEDEEDSERIEERKQAFADLFREKVLLDFANPLFLAVSALPRQDLAKMAESLVNLTAFLKRMTVDDEETVSEPIDVALLSKGDGFIWVKHKDVHTLAHDRSIST